MKAQLRHHAVAVMLLAPLAATFVAQPAAAQERAAAPQIKTMSLNANDGLKPGSVLRIRVEGTPGSHASVNFGKTDITVDLRESESGVYTGRYAVREGDRIDPTASMHVRLTRDKVVASHSFTYPPSFQALASNAAPTRAAPPVEVAAGPARIERFTRVPVARVEAGRELRYRVHGAPGATVTLEIPGIVSGVAMREVRPGLYEAAYTIRERDALDRFATAIATLRSGDRWVSSRLDNAYVVRDRDERAPAISAITPDQGDIVAPDSPVYISGRFDDGEGRGVNPQSVRITVDGRDMTGNADITPERFSLRHDLPPGRYTVDVSARDRAGNVANRSWSFDVGHPQRMAGPSR